MHVNNNRFMLASLKNNQRLVITLALAFGLSFAGCSTETTSSENVTTQGIYADMDIEAKESGSSGINVQLSVGGPTGTTIELATGERLEAEANGITQVLQQDNDIFSVDYEGVIATDTSGTEFTVTFTRSNGDVLNNSRVTLPEDFEIASPQTGQTYSVEDNLPLVWTAPSATGQAITVSTVTTCTSINGGEQVFAENSSVADTGSNDFPLGGLLVATSDQVNRTINCSMDVMLVRERTGQIDTRFGEGGSITGEQSREVEGITLSF